ncbi:Aquaporin-4 [Homalodisca vitripennis]|nr:Aquaporin-4 [Homalodisca vitripennis]
MSGGQSADLESRKGDGRDDKATAIVLESLSVPLSKNTKKIIGIDDITDTKTIWRCLAAELIGTLLLVLVGTGSCTGVQVSNTGDPVVRIALTFGFIIATMVQCASARGACCRTLLPTLGARESTRATEGAVLTAQGLRGRLVSQVIPQGIKVEHLVEGQADVLSLLLDNLRPTNVAQSSASSATYCAELVPSGTERMVSSVRNRRSSIA